MKSLFQNYILKNQFLIAIVVIVVAQILFRAIEIVYVFFIAYIIMAALVPFHEFLIHHKFPKILATIIPYFVILIIFAGFILPFISIFGAEFQNAAVNLPRYLDKPIDVFGFKIDLTQVQVAFSNQLNSLSRDIFALSNKVFNTLLMVIVSIVLSLYLLFYRLDFHKVICSFFARTPKDQTEEILDKIEKKLGSWLHGQLLLSLSVGIMAYIALLILNVPFALPLALLTGILEIIPTLGPIISSIPPIILALSISPSLGGLVLLSFVVIQQIENHILVPQIMRRAVDLNPVVVILTILLSFQLLGIVGGLLSVPFVSLLTVIYNNVHENNNSTTY